MKNSDFQVRHQAAEEKLKDIGRVLKQSMPPGWGFILLLESFGEKGNTFYMSSVERAGAIESLRTLADKLEKGFDS